MVDLEAEPLQLFGIALPVLGDLDVEVKIDPLAEQRLDPLAGGGADLTKARSTFADDDCLLAGPFDEDVDPDVEQRRDLRAARPRQHLVDDDGQAVRHLVVKPLKGCLADELGDHDDLRLVGQHTVGVQHRRGRQVGREQRGDLADLVAAHGRARDDGSPFAKLVHGYEVLGQPRSLDPVALRRERHDRSVLGQHQLGQLPGDVRVARADPLVGRQAEADHVHLQQRLADHVVQALAQQRSGFVQTWRVDQDQLPRLRGHDPPDGVPGGLWLARRDGDLLADHRVRQRRLAGVGTLHQTGEIGPEFLGHDASSCMLLRLTALVFFVVAKRRTITVSIRWRRPAMRSAVSDSPATSPLEPGIGTSPMVFPSRPPTVSTSSSSRVTSKSSARSSTCIVAGTRVEPSSSSSTPGASRSYSSSISPTISSRMSSRVTKPAVPPYSSMTMAKWFWSRCISRNRSSMGLLSGMYSAGRIWPRTDCLAALASP